MRKNPDELKRAFDPGDEQEETEQSADTAETSTDENAGASEDA